MCLSKGRRSISFLFVFLFVFLVVCLFVVFFFQAEDGIRDVRT